MEIVNTAAKGLADFKAKVKAYEILFGCAPRVRVSGYFREVKTGDEIVGRYGGLPLVSVNRRTVTLRLPAQDEEVRVLLPEHEEVDMQMSSPDTR